MAQESEHSELTKYKFSSWPFREVPQLTGCTFLAGRPELSTALGRLIARKTTVSSVYLFWASLGAGKTHALYYLINKTRTLPHFLPIYTEYPESQASFHTLYQMLAQRIPWDDVVDSCLNLFTNPDPVATEGLHEIKSVHPDIYRAFFLLAESDDPLKAKFSRRWLRGDSLSRADLRTAGLSKSLSAPSECAAAISVLARVLGLKSKVSDSAEGTFRLIWVLDEAQRLAKAPPKLNQEVNAGLQSTINLTPDYLTLILSFSGLPEKQLPMWLRPELADRIGMRNLMLLPPFNKYQAKVFFRELLAQFNSEGAPVSPYFPFTEGAVDYMITRVLKGKLALIEGFTEAQGVRPRALIKCAHAVVEEHYDSGEPLPITEHFVASIFPKRT